MSYEQIGWQNKPSTATPINATNLNHMDAGIAANDAAIGTLNTAVQGKVDKVEGKGLSTNDFTDADALKLAGIEDGAEVNVQADWGQTDNTADDYIKNKPDLSVYAEKDALWQDATATGNPVTIKTQSAQAAKQTVITMSPMQSGSGTPSPQNNRPISGRMQAKIVGCGKNMLNLTVDGIKTANTTGTWRGNIYTIDGNTFEILTDASNNVVGIKVNGTFSSTVGFNLTSNANLPKGNYIINGCPSGLTNSSFLAFYNKDTSQYVDNRDYGSGGSVSLGDANYSVRIRNGNNAVLTNAIFKPMVRPSAETDATYEPYVQGDDVTISFGQTVYGGTRNVETGELKVDTLRIELATLNWNATTSSGIFYADDDLLEFIGVGRTIITCDSLESVDNVSGLGGARTNPDCSICGYSGSGTHRFYIRWDAKGTSVSDLVSALNGVYACYKLATPQTTTLTAAQVNLLKGLNNVSTDADGISLTYFADGESLTDADNRITAVLGDFATVEGARASQNYSVGDYLIFADKFCKASAAIATGEVLAIGTNLTQTTIGAELKAILAQL